MDINLIVQLIPYFYKNNYLTQLENSSFSTKTIFVVLFYIPRPAHNQVSLKVLQIKVQKVDLWEGAIVQIVSQVRNFVCNIQFLVSKVDQPMAFRTGGMNSSG